MEKGGSNKMNKRKIRKIVKPEDFYGKSIIDIPMSYCRWIWNWKFPFLHRKTIKLTLPQSQAVMNRLLNDYLNKTN